MTTDTRPRTDARCRSIMFTAKNRIELQSGPAPKVTDAGQVLVRNLNTLISPGTELSLLTGAHVGFADPKNTYAKYPHPPGYAAVGRVLESRADGFAAGDLVYHEGFHTTMQVLTPDAQTVVKVPQGCEPRHVPFARLAQISSTAYFMAEAVRDARVLVVGLGLIGNLAAQVFRAAGAHVTACEPTPERVAIARDCALDDLVQGGTDAVLAKLDTGEIEPFDITVESTGVPALVVDCLKLTRHFGQSILLGSARGSVDLDVYNLIHRTGIRLTGAHVNLLGPAAARQGKTIPALTADILDQIARGDITVAPAITATVTPDTAKGAYDRLQSHPGATLGVLIDWQQESDHA